MPRWRYIAWWTWHTKPLRQCRIYFSTFIQPAVRSWHQPPSPARTRRIEWGEVGVVRAGDVIRTRGRSALLTGGAEPAARAGTSPGSPSPSSASAVPCTNRPPTTIPNPLLPRIRCSAARRATPRQARHQPPSPRPSRCAPTNRLRAGFAWQTPVSNRRCISRPREPALPGERCVFSPSPSLLRPLCPLR